MSAPETPPRSPRRWLKAALIASLAVNLLFIGAGVARFVVGEAPERVAGLSQVQLIPRKFFSELEGPRKAELLGVFRSFGPAFRDGRKAARNEVSALATALEAEPYDPARVKAVVDAFSGASEALVAQGGQAALTLIEKLSPEERKLLAQHIRQRGERGPRRGEEKRGGG
jgi:hypothetical protein